MTVVLVFVVTLAGCGNSSSTESIQGKEMTVYHSPSCSCCERYVEYLREKGMDVKAVKKSRAELPMIKAQHGVPRRAYSFHTGRIDGYTVEGHVPAEAIAKLLNEQPDLAGISIPKMPRNTPGMGKPLGKTFDVTSIDEDGRTGTFTSVTY
ncbi:MAG: DUF411 domain-containing protein [bacterium]